MLDREGSVAAAGSRLDRELPRGGSIGYAAGDVQRIFVGDVQGCADELEVIFARAREHFGEDWELWVVGDLVNRGPDNLRALRLVREQVEAGRAHYVLGNHEIHLLESALGVREPSRWDSFQDVLDSPEANSWVDWLCSRPLAVATRQGSQELVMLHASSHPDWSLADLLAHAEAAAAPLRGDREALRAWLASTAPRDPARDDMDRLTRGRSVRPDGSWSSEAPGPEGEGLAWHREWSRREHAFGIVYGHWSLQGLHVAKGLRGLDTGCVHHGRGKQGFLTAWLPDPSLERPFEVPDSAFWQIPARRSYYAHRDA